MGILERRRNKIEELMKKKTFLELEKKMKTSD